MNPLDHVSPTGSPCGEKPSAFVGLLKFASLIALVAIASGIGNGIVGSLRVPASPGIQSAIDATVVAVLIVYIVLMALPFCPGIEIGLALIALMGPTSCRSSIWRPSLRCCWPSWPAGSFPRAR